jgi:hypothetical protein
MFSVGEELMTFRACPRKGDPFERKVRETYGASVVGAPRAGIDPLITVARQDDRVEVRGHLRYILEGDPLALPKVISSPAVGMSGTRSAQVEARLGLDLSAKFLSALGLPMPGADVAATLWAGASTFTFEVRDVMDNQVDLAELGQAINGRVVGQTPATDIFLTDKSQQLLLITRTLTTPTFAVRANRAHGQVVNIAVDGIKDLVGSANAKVSWERENDDWVSFHGATPVTFGFAVVPCFINAARQLMFGLTSSDVKFGVVPSRAPEVQSRPVIEDDRAGLLSFD